MLSTKAFLLILALLASVVGFVTYLHRQQAQIDRPLRPDEKQTVQSLGNWSKSLKDQKSK